MVEKIKQVRDEVFPPHQKELRDQLLGRAPFALDLSPHRSRTSIALMASLIGMTVQHAAPEMVLLDSIDVDDPFDPSAFVDAMMDKLWDKQCRGRRNKKCISRELAVEWGIPERSWKSREMYYDMVYVDRRAFKRYKRKAQAR